MTSDPSNQPPLDPGAMHARVLRAYEELGYPHDVVGSWAISDNDVEDFVRLVVAANPRAILEVGTFVGVSTMLMALACPDARIVTVDPDLPLTVEMGSAGSSLGDSDAAATTFEIARKVAEALQVADRIVFAKGGFAVADTFSSFLSKEGETMEVVGPQICKEHGPFDFAFVDGLHTAEAVMADLELAAGALTENAPMVLHDCVGFWGANVRSGVHNFVRRRPDYCFSHPKYAQIYKSVGVLRRRGSSNFAADRRPFGAGEVSPLLIQALARLTKVAIHERPLVELRFGVELLAKAYEHDPYASVVLGRRTRARSSGSDREEVAAVVEALQSLGDDAAAFSAELLDFTPDQLLIGILRAALERKAPMVLPSTPPGEIGVAGPESRPLARVVDLVEAAGGAVYAQAALDLESERYALLPEARSLGESSLFASFIVVAAPGGYTDGRGRSLIQLTAETAAEREQLELQRVHMTAAYRRYFEDWRKVVGDNERAAQQVEGLLGRIETLRGRLAQAPDIEELRVLTERFASLSAAYAELADGRTAMQAETVQNLQALFVEREAKAIAIAHLAEAEARLVEVTTELGDVRGRLGETEVRLVASSAELDDARERLVASSAELDDARERLVASSAELNDVRERLVTSEVELSDVRGRVDDLDARRAHLAAALEAGKRKHEMLLGVSIEVFEAMDALDARLEQHALALETLGFTGAPPRRHVQHEADFDLLHHADVAEELAAMRASAQWSAERMSDVASLVAKLREDNAGLETAISEMRSSSSWRLTAPLRGLRMLPRRLRRAPQGLVRRVRAYIYGRRLVKLQAELDRRLAAAGLNAVVFDADWYARIYADVPASRALQHYLAWGEEEGRKPHEKFDPEFYKAQYPDVAASRISPLVHFLAYGLKEGRSPSPALHPLRDRALAARVPPLEYYAGA